MIPNKYVNLSEIELNKKIESIKKDLGKQLVILGHHYQKEEVIVHTDVMGDSLELCQKAAVQTHAKYIVFCGVHFMAESADILTAENQIVQLPDMAAGCPLADFANIDQVEEAWKVLDDVIGVDQITPVTYINSTAKLKAFCGRNRGSVCTSSNAEIILNWAFNQSEKVFFFPDQHLGRNTALKMNIPQEDIVLWNEKIFDDIERLKKARVILWDGHCHVHTFFTVDHVASIRRQYPGVHVIVHPECDSTVVQASDDNGSTGYLIRYVENAPEGSTIAIGTELNLVNRLANTHKDKTVIPLSKSYCDTMNKINLGNLLYTLDNIGAYNIIKVAEETKRDAKIALDRMLSHN